MSPSELRIGNFVNHNTKGIVEIKGNKPHSGDYMLVLDDEWVYLKNSKPIFLTEQWLINFGMEMPINEDPIFEYGKGEYNDCFNHFKKTSQSLIDASFEYDGKEFWADSNGFWFKIMHTYTHVEYVHQFQNLIFALTGKELTLQK